MSKIENQKTTKRLEDMLKNVKGERDAAEFIAKNLNDGYETFAEYFNDYIAYKRLKLPDIMAKSGVSRNYFYNILNGDRNPGRDKIIALCIGAGMNYDETNRALKIAGTGILYPKNERDIRIGIAINNRVASVLELNLVLEREGLRIIE